MDKPAGYYGVKHRMNRSYNNNVSTRIDSAAPFERQVQMSSPVPKDVRFFVLAVSFCLAVSFLEIPLLKLSLSAPLMYLLFFLILKRPNGVTLHQAFFSKIIAFLFVAIILSSFINALIGKTEYDFILLLKTIARYSYWLLCGLIICGIIYRYQLGHEISLTFSAGIVVTGIAVLIDYFFLGGLTTAGISKLTGTSKNDYAMQFSSFLPFLFYPMFFMRGKNRLLAWAGLIVCLLAIIINTSRSAWVSTVLVIGIYVMLYVMLFPRKGHRLLLGSVALIFSLCFFLLLPIGYREEIEERYRTLESLEQDKSWQVRQLMVQKGWRLFLENPVLGVGPYQFRSASIELELPQVLSYGRHYTDFASKSAHNAYVQLLAEGGLAMAIPFGILLIWLAVSGGRASVRLGREGKAWTLSLYAGLVGMSIHLWTLSGLTTTTPWFLYGMMAAIINTAGREKKTRKRRRIRF